MDLDLLLQQKQEQARIHAHPRSMSSGVVQIDLLRAQSLQYGLSAISWDRDIKLCPESTDFFKDRTLELDSDQLFLMSTCTGMDLSMERRIINNSGYGCSLIVL